MKRIAIILTAILFVLSPLAVSAAEKASVGKTYSADVVIYGGTCAAVTAAVQVKKMGKSVLIVSPDKKLGGLSSHGLGSTDSGERRVIGGLSREFYGRIWQHYQKKESWNWQKMPAAMAGQGGRGIDNETKTMWIFEPHVAQKVFDDFLKEYNIQVFTDEWLDRSTSGVEKTGARINSIRTLSGKKFVGKIFLDTTYEGDLMATAGVKYTVGRESNEQYGETLNGVQVKNARFHQFEGFVDPYVVPGKPESGLLPFVHEKINGPDGTGDKFIQAYNLRLCMTQVPENRVPFTKPENYRELDYELLLRNIAAGQKIFMADSIMPNFKTDTNNSKGVSTDYIGGNYDYPDASYEERAKFFERHRSWCQGLFWTLANNPRVPKDIRDWFSSWGLAKDEFTETNNWPAQMYVREARRMLGVTVVSERHLRYLEPTLHSIGMGSYNMDSHNTQRYVDYTMFDKPTVRNEGDVEINPGAPYPIDYGAILPKKNEAENLLVPVCVSSTHIAFGSIRMEPVYMALGQSAATAAVLSIEKGIAPQDLDYEVLEKRLLADKQILEADSLGLRARSVPKIKLKGTVLDNDEAVVKGEWGYSTVCDSFVGMNYLHDANEGKGSKSIEYRFKLAAPGQYDCRISWNRNPNRAENVPVTVSVDGKKATALTINQKNEPKIDKLFQSLGVFQAEKEIVILIETKGTNGHVIVDAAQLLKK